MKPLDEHLHDASNAWMQEARPVIVATEEHLVGSLNSFSLSAWIAGGLGAVAIVATSWWLLSSEPDSPPAQPISPSKPVVEAVSVEQTPVITTTPPSTPFTVEKKDISRTEDPILTAADHQKGFTTNGSVDGFSAEYERILSRAMRFESADPLRAATEYMGLGRLCLARQQYAHAVSVLQRAEELCRRGQFTHLTSSVQSMLDDAQRQMDK